LAWRRTAAHHWARELRALGHDVVLVPAQYVKPYVKRSKSDAADAEAICEAMSRPSMRLFRSRAPINRPCRCWRSCVRSISAGVPSSPIRFVALRRSSACRARGALPARRSVGRHSHRRDAPGHGQGHVRNLAARLCAAALYPESRKNEETEYLSVSRRKTEML
jgi:transposase